MIARQTTKYVLALALCPALADLGCSSSTSGGPGQTPDASTAGGPGQGGAAAGNGGVAPGSGGAPSGGSGNPGGSAGKGGVSGGGGGGAAGGSGGAAGAGSGGAIGATGGTAGTGTGGAPTIGPVLDAGNPGPADVTFEVRADQSVHAISPYVYGTNGAPDIANNHQTIVRSGGNRMTAYNWENNASNAGSDYQFQNDSFLSSSSVPGKVISDLVDVAKANKAAAVVTIPLVDYVAADKNGGGDVRNSGSNYLATRFKKNLPAKGSAFSAMPNTTDDSVYEDEFVSWLKGAEPGATVLFLMDNEPDLWSSTHAEVHPNPVTYAELWDRNHKFSKAAKAVWPSAEILGFVSYGFNGYVSLQNASDANGRNFIDWYLDQAKAAEATDGKRLIDYLDLHWYPEARGGGQRVTDGDNSAAVVAAREQAPRSLWDASYSETSWVRDYLAAPIDLLHWLGKKVTAHYPGTRLAFSEWDYGGGDHISGAIAVADALGIYGKESVGLATYWPLKADESFAYAAFRAYRNFDGSGAAFGDTSVAATSSDVPVATVYASIDAANTHRTVIVAINKATTAKSAAIRIAHSASYKTARVFVLTGGQAALTAGAGLTAVAANAFHYDMPAQSVSVIVPAE
jgi:hypothetical protein